MRMEGVGQTRRHTRAPGFPSRHFDANSQRIEFMKAAQKWPILMTFFFRKVFFFFSLAWGRKFDLRNWD